MQLKARLRSRVERGLRRLETTLTRYQKTYLALITLVALTGYFLILLLPLLVIMGMVQIIQLLTTAGVMNWPALSFWSGLTLFCGLLCFRYLKYQPVSPKGVSLKSDKIPGIFELVDKARGHYKRPRIHQIVITPDYELDIVKTPPWPVPLWSNNSLVIGLPLLQCLSPEQFECMLGRRIGQYSKSHNFLTNWLYQLRSTWTQYARGYEKVKSADSKILYWLFRLFAALYNRVTVYVVRRDELYADAYAMELYNHEIVRETMTAQAIYSRFLKHNFWPAISKRIRENPSAGISPYQQLRKTLDTHLKGRNLQGLIQKAFQEQPAWNEPQPSLAMRLQQIAHDTPHLPERGAESASDHFLGPLQNSMIRMMDKLWLSRSRR